MTSVIAGLTMVVFLAALPGRALAQGPATGPEDQRMTRMMQMMEQMQTQMKDMRGQMMQMGQMHERMRGMMQEQHADTQKMCPGMAGPDSTKKGG
jgi:hypothetical protein